MLQETKVALIQRSCGYALRPTLDIAEIDMAVQVIKSHNPDCIIAVDNCYGEFTSAKEPCAVSISALPLTAYGICPAGNILSCVCGLVCIVGSMHRGCLGVIVQAGPV